MLCVFKQSKQLTDSAHIQARGQVCIKTRWADRQEDDRQLWPAKLSSDLNDNSQYNQGPSPGKNDRLSLTTGCGDDQTMGLFYLKYCTLFYLKCLFTTIY